MILEIILRLMTLIIFGDYFEIINFIDFLDYFEIIDFIDYFEIDLIEFRVYFEIIDLNDLIDFRDYLEMIDFIDFLFCPVASQSTAADTEAYRSGAEHDGDIATPDCTEAHRHCHARP